MNTLESIKKDCSESGWDGYTAEPINDVVLENAKLVQPFIPDDFELFPCGDGSEEGYNAIVNEILTKLNFIRESSGNSAEM